MSNDVPPELRHIDAFFRAAAIGIGLFLTAIPLTLAIGVLLMMAFAIGMALLHAAQFMLTFSFDPIISSRTGTRILVAIPKVASGMALTIVTVAAFVKPMRDELLGWTKPNDQPSR